MILFFSDVCIFCTEIILPEIKNMKDIFQKIALLFLAVLVMVSALNGQEKINPSGQNAVPQLIVQTGHTSDIQTLWFTSDEKNLISQSDDRIIFWEVKHGLALRAVENQKIYDVSESAGVVATIDIEENLIFWEIRTGKKLFRLENEKECSFNRSGKLLVCKNNRDLINVRNSLSGQVLREFSFADRTISDFAFGINEKIIISSLPLVTEEEISDIPPPPSLSPPNLRNDLPGKNETVKQERPRNFLEVYDVKAEKPIFILNDKKTWGVNQDGTLLVTENESGNLTIRDLADGSKEIFSGDQIEGWEFSPDGRFFVFLSENKTLDIWNIAKRQTRVTNIKREYLDTKFVPGGKLIYFNQDEKAHFYNLETGNPYFKVDYAYPTISPDGRYFAVTTNEVNEKVKMLLWDLENRKQIFATQEFEYSGDVVFSRDSKFFAVDLNGLYVWNTQDSKEILKVENADTGNKFLLDILTPLPSLIASITESPDLRSSSKVLRTTLTKNNKRLLTGQFEQYREGTKTKFINQNKTLVFGLENGVIDFWDVSKRTKLRSFKNHASPIRISLTKDKSSLLIRDAFYEKLWNYQKGGFSQVKKSKNLLDKLDNEEPTKDNESVYDIYEWDFVDKVNQTGTYYLREKKTQKNVFEFANVEDCQMDYNGKYFGCYRKLSDENYGVFTLEIYEIKTKKLLFQIAKAVFDYQRKSIFDEENSRLQITTYDEDDDSNRFEIWSMEGQRLFVSGGGLDDYAFGDADNLVLGFDDRLEWHNLKTGDKKDFTFRNDFAVDISRKRVFVDPKGRHLAFTGLSFTDQENRIYVWNTKTNRIFWRTEHSAKIYNAEFTPDERFLITAGEDGTVRVWDISTEKLVLTLIPLDENDWVVVDADGRFDASEGAAKLMQWRVGNDSISFEQLKERYYEPNLWQKVLGFSREPLRDVSVLKNVLLPPEVLDENSVAVKR